MRRHINTVHLLLSSTATSMNPQPNTAYTLKTGAFAGGAVTSPLWNDYHIKQEFLKNDTNKQRFMQYLCVKSEDAG